MRNVRLSQQSEHFQWSFIQNKKLNNIRRTETRRVKNSPPQCHPAWHRSCAGWSGTYCALLPPAFPSDLIVKKKFKNIGSIVHMSVYKSIVRTDRAHKKQQQILAQVSKIIFCYQCSIKQGQVFFTANKRNTKITANKNIRTQELTLQVRRGVILILH